MSLFAQLTPESSLPSARSADCTGLEGRNPSRFRGLCWDKKHQAWRVRIFYCGKQRHVGRYKDDVAAARAYDKAAMHLYGAKAILNFTIAECLADPTEVSSFIILAKQQAMQQQQQHLYCQLPNPAAAVATPVPDTILLQCNVSSTGSHTEEDETYQQLSLLESQRALSPVHDSNNAVLGQQQQWALQQQLQTPVAGQQQSSNSGALMVWQQLQQHHMKHNEGLLYSNSGACWGYSAAAAVATVASGVEIGCMLLQGASDSSSGSNSAVLLQPSALGAAPTAVGMSQQCGLLNALNAGSHGGGSLPSVQHTCAVLPNNEPQVLLLSVQHSHDKLNSYSYGSINSCIGTNVVHPTCHHQLPQQAMFSAQQGQQFAVGNVAVGSNSCCNSTIHRPTTLLQSPYASTVEQQLLQQQPMTFAPAITTSNSDIAMACSGLAPICTLPDIHQVQSQLTPQVVPASSCNAAAMMASLLQSCSISQRAAH